MADARKEVYDKDLYVIVEDYYDKDDKTNATKYSDHFFELEDLISSISRKKEALGKVKITIEYDGEKYIAKAADTDILKASALAYMNAVNSIVSAGLREISVEDMTINK